MTEDKIKTIFSKKGVVTDVQLKYTSAGVFRRFGFIGFETESEALAAAEYFNNSCINTTRITVEQCKTLGEIIEKPYGKTDKSKKVQEENDEEKTSKKTKKKQVETVEDIIKEHKSDPLFMEFMQSHSKSTKFWDGDVAIPENDRDEIPNRSENLEDKNLSKSGNKMGDKMVTAVVKKIDKSKVDTDLFTVKLMNIPYKTRRSDIQKFFKPIKPYSIRIPRHGFAFAGFKTKLDFNKALTKDRSFLSKIFEIFQNMYKK